ncbi:MAG TPA: transcription antitermination factor NusB [Mycobacteriales bacterium]|nr:transcription antitermination factor NusB [Mycobacteriales bacterium]
MPDRAGGGPATRRGTRQGPRAAARDLLVAVDTTHAYANLTLPRLLADSGMSVRDRAFATELGYGSLRALGSIDHLLAPHLSRSLERLEPEVRAALRLGAYQLWRTRVPRHAAVGQSVALVHARARGFVNAVLRRVADDCDGPDPLRLQDVTDPLERLGLRYAHPRWIVEAYLEALGGDLAEAEVALAADDSRPVVHLAAVPGRMTVGELVVESAGRAGRLSPYAVHLDEGGDPGRLRSVRTGAARVQDEGSQLCALALHRALPAAGVARAQLDADLLMSDEPAPGPLIDLTAGPGGKAALRAALAAGRRDLVAVEVRPHRARLVARTGLRAVVVADGRRAPFRPGAAEAVLLDAPCTGVGALRRRPEARWRRQPADARDLVIAQRELVAAALELIRPGGLLAYVVCSPLLAEAVLAPPPGTEVLDAPALLGLGSDARAPDTGGRRLQLWPHRHGTDAMSAVILRKTGR